MSHTNTVTPTQPMTDNSIMPFGMHRGKALVNIPAKYFMWLFDKGCDHEGVRKYILSNLEVLKKEAGYVK